MRHRKKSEGPPLQGGPTQNQETRPALSLPRQLPESSRALRRRRRPFPFGNLRRLQRSGQLSTWLEIATATRLSVTGEPA